MTNYYNTTKDKTLITLFLWVSKQKTERSCTISFREQGHCINCFLATNEYLKFPVCLTKAQPVFRNQENNGSRKTHLPLLYSHGLPTRSDLFIDAGKEILRDPQGILQEWMIRMAHWSVLEQILPPGTQAKKRTMSTTGKQKGLKAPN